MDEEHEKKMLHASPTIMSVHENSCRERNITARDSSSAVTHDRNNRGSSALRVLVSEKMKT